MKCPKFEKLNLYIDGELTTDEMSEVKNHLSTCVKCRSFIEEAITAEQLMSHKVHQYIEYKSSQRAILATIQTQKIVPITNHTHKPIIFKFALASMFSLVVCFALYFSYTKPSVPNFYCNYSIQSSNSHCLLDGRYIQNSRTFKGKLSEYHHYSGRFVFNISFKRQTTTISWNGSGSLLMSPQGEMSIQASEGTLKYLAGEKININFNGKLLKNQTNIIILKPMKKESLSTNTKIIVKKPYESNIASVSISRVSAKCASVKTIIASEPLHTIGYPQSSAPVVLDDCITPLTPSSQTMINPFVTNGVRLTAGQEEYSD